MLRKCKVVGSNPTQSTILMREGRAAFSAQFLCFTNKTELDLVTRKDLLLLILFRFNFITGFFHAIYSLGD